MVTNAIRLAEDIGAPAHCQKRMATDTLRPMRWVASLFALGLMMALFHRVTAGAPLEARATLALGFLLLVAYVGGEIARRVRLPRLTGYLLVGFAVGPAWLGLVQREEVDALRFIEEAAVALIGLAAGSELTLDALRRGRMARARLTSAGALNVAVAGTAILQLLGSAAVGTLLGYALGQYLGLVRRDSAVFLVATAFVAAEVARLTHLETLIIALAAGFYLENFAPVEGERLRRELKRGALRGYVAVFALTGAGLRVGVLADLWPWILLLVGLRLVGLRYGLLWAGRHSSVTPVLARHGWLGLISQAGMALGLAQLARRAFPEWGVSLETLIVAMIGVHELVGPICFRTAVVRAGEITEENRDAEAPVDGRSAVATRGGL